MVDGVNGANVATPVEKSPTSQAKTQAKTETKLVDDLLNQWPVKILTSMLPGGAIIDEIIQDIVGYIETVEKAVAIKGAGVAKKSIVTETTVEYLLKKFPMLEPFAFIVKWAVKEIIDWIVSMKNQFGWSWIPIKNG